VAYAVLAAGLAAAVVIDLRSRRIPNLLTATMAVLGLGLAATGFGSVTLAASVGGMVLGLVLMLPGHALGATGAGDVKLMAAVGAILGPGLVFPAFLFTCIAGGVLAVAVAISRRRFAETVAGTGRLIAAPANARTEIQGAAAARRFAYGPAIAAGSVIAVVIG
jgi:prepilin peptidase CpaA